MNAENFLTGGASQDSRLHR